MEFFYFILFIFFRNFGLVFETRVLLSFFSRDSRYNLCGAVSQGPYGLKGWVYPHGLSLHQSWIAAMPLLAMLLTTLIPPPLHLALGGFLPQRSSRVV